MTDHDIESRVITNRAEWLMWRLGDLTASDVGVLFHVHQYRTLLRVWAEKAGMTMGEAENPTMARGRYGEAACIEMLGEERPFGKCGAARSIYATDASD